MRKTMIAAAVAVAGFVGVAADVVHAGREDPRSLEGTWWVEVTLVDCASRAPRPPFVSLLSFDRAGTLVETTNNPVFQPGQRSPGHGVWKRTGARTFEAFSDAFIMFSSAPNPPASPGFARGRQRITQSITMAKGDADTFDSEATVAFFDASGAELLGGCATAVGHRY